MVFVTGDCHGNFRRFQSECFPEQANMTKGDTVTAATMKHWTGWNTCPSRSPSSAATMKTMTRWNDIRWTIGTAARYIAFALMCCT